MPQRTVFILFVLFSFIAFDLRFFSDPQWSHLFCHFVALMCVNRLLFGLRNEFIVCWIVERCRLIRHEVIAVWISVQLFRSSFSFLLVVLY